MSKLIATLLILALSIQTISAKPRGHWNAVKALASYSIAVKTKKGETLYGLLESADDTGIMLRVAGKEDFTGQGISFRREEVAKVWRAKLRFGERNVAKAAWIGTGAGVGAMLVVTAAWAAANTDSPSIAPALLPILGGVTGALAGKLWRKKHKKQELVYSI